MKTLQEPDFVTAGCADELAAMWGCDPCYDSPPNLPGDGYKFYNFSVEKSDAEFLRDFAPAIERTIKSVELRRQADPQMFSDDDVEDLKDLLGYVQALIAQGEK